jgi:hypothetical protein
VKVEDNISIILENEDGSNEINATCLWWTISKMKIESNEKQKSKSDKIYLWRKMKM